MTKIRVTIDTVASGQPRPYADSRTEAYVLLERTNWDGKGDFIPWELKSFDGKPYDTNNVPEVLKQYVPGLRVQPKSAQKYALEPYLASFGPASERGPGWWRYVTISPFTD